MADWGKRVRCGCGDRVSVVTGVLCEEPRSRLGISKVNRGEKDGLKLL